MSKTIVIHGCGVTSVGEDTEGLTPEGEMRVFSSLKSIIAHDEEIAVYLTGGKAQVNEGQKKSEAYYMKEYLVKVLEELGIDREFTIHEEGESTDTFENIKNVIKKTQESLTNALTTPEFNSDHKKKKMIHNYTPNIDVYTSHYHTHRARLLWKKQIKSHTKGKIGVTLLSADKQEFKDIDIEKKYEELKKKYHEQRSQRTLGQKFGGRATEVVGTVFSYLGMDKFLSSIHEKIFKRKKKE